MEFYTSLLGARKSCTTEGRRFLRFLRLIIASFWLLHFGSKFYLEKVHILPRCTQGLYQSQSPQPYLSWGRQSHFHVINSCDFSGQESRIFLIIHCILILSSGFHIAGFKYWLSVLTDIFVENFQLFSKNFQFFSNNFQFVSKTLLNYN